MIAKPLCDGDNFGRWTVLNGGRAALIFCRCSCGIERLVRGVSLRNGSSKSCGCVAVEKNRLRETKHGKSHTAIWWAWSSMIARCTNKKHQSYHRYGGRGITVCDRWLNFENFFADVGDRPYGMSLDRKNNDLGYMPSNCRWATQKEQSRNTSRTIFAEFEGDRLPLIEISERIKVPVATLRYRLARELRKIEKRYET